MFVVSPSTRLTAMAGAFGERGLVGGLDASRSPRPERPPGPRAGTPAASARGRSYSRGSVSFDVASGFSRISCRFAGPAAARLTVSRAGNAANAAPDSSRRIDRPRHEAGARKRPRRIVDEHDVGLVADGREGVRHRILAPRVRRPPPAAAFGARWQIRRRIAGKVRRERHDRLPRRPGGREAAATLRSRIGRPPIDQQLLRLRGRRTAGRGRPPR